MSDFRVPVVRVRAIEPIEGADKIELAVVGDYRCVTQKGRFQPGELAVYLPEAGILPDALLDFMDLRGKLSGADKNRIKAVKLRGCLSQGILMNPTEVSDFLKESAIPVSEGTDFADLLGITKYEPRIPAHMQGEVCNMYGHTLHFDVENIKAWPDVFEEGELVDFTEKVHGTFCAITHIPGLDNPELLNGDTLVYSKGLGGKGLVFKDNIANTNNIYLRTVKEYEIAGRMRHWASNDSGYSGKPFTILGEIYGAGVQDLQYGAKKPLFMMFDVYLGKPSEGHWGNRSYHMPWVASKLGLMSVPNLYRGPFSKEKLAEVTSGRTIAGNDAHIREGVVVTPMAERTHPELGRVILKSVSPDYLLRKGSVTEYT